MIVRAPQRGSDDSSSQSTFRLLRKPIAADDIVRRSPACRPSVGAGSPQGRRLHLHRSGPALGQIFVASLKFLPASLGWWRNRRRTFGGVTDASFLRPRRGMAVVRDFLSGR
jgi:hypothetical protein